jgi:hypothetical protein
MNPPEANCGPAEQKSISDRPPLIWTRRIGAACDTAQNSLPVWQPVCPITLMVRFDIERQKFTSAVQSVGAPGGVGKHWLSTSIEPLICTSVGLRPSPATSV